jgi:hypothetical protein
VWQSVGPFQHMPHRELLTESQRLSLQAPASDERGVVRHYTLSSEDLALINRRRGDPNRLGFALMLCYLRFRGGYFSKASNHPLRFAPLLPSNWASNLLGCYAYSVPEAVTRGELRPLRNPDEALEEVP